MKDVIKKVLVVQMRFQSIFEGLVDGISVEIKGKRWRINLVKIWGGGVIVEGWVFRRLVLN